MNVGTSLTLGGALVILLEVIRYYFPQLSANWLKLIVGILSIAAAIVMYIASNNPSVNNALNDLLLIVTSSQAFYALFVQGSDIHATLTETNANIEEADETPIVPEVPVEVPTEIEPVIEPVTTNPEPIITTDNTVV